MEEERDAPQLGVQVLLPLGVSLPLALRPEKETSPVIGLFFVSVVELQNVVEGDVILKFLKPF